MALRIEGDTVDGTGGGSYQLRRFQSASAFLERAGDWLLADEAENNLILALAARLQRDARGYQPPIYLATIEESDRVVGCVLRTPPHKPIFTAMPLEALPALVADLRSTYDSIPSVLGPDAQARRFADLWSSSTGVPWKIGMRHRIYRLSTVIPPARPAPGMLRLAQPHDLELVTRWIIDFSTEVAMPGSRARGMAEDRIRSRELFLWDDGAPRSMAAWAGDTPSSVRIGYVYTPPDQRGRGYASALTAAVSQRALDSGYRYCVLFTDLANPTSNSIYQAIGYEPVCDVNDYVFGGD